MTPRALSCPVVCASDHGVRSFFLLHLVLVSPRCRQTTAQVMCPREAVSVFSCCAQCAAVQLSVVKTSVATLQWPWAGNTPGRRSIFIPARWEPVVCTKSRSWPVDRRVLVHAAEFSTARKDTDAVAREQVQQPQVASDVASCRVAHQHSMARRGQWRCNLTAITASP